MPSGYHLNPQAPFTYHVAVDGTGVTVAEADRQCSAMVPNLTWPLLIPFQAASGEDEARLTIDLTFYYCQEADAGLCIIQSVRWNVPIRTTVNPVAAELVVSYAPVVPEVKHQRYHLEHDKDQPE